MKARLIEVVPDNCRGCRLCEMVCSLTHERECSTSKSRIKVKRDKDWAYDFPVLCMHCAEAPCMENCPTEAIYRDGQSGAVLVNIEACVSCGICVDVCPFNALFLSADEKVICKCDLCAGDPKCVKWCPNGALILNDAEIDSSERKAIVEHFSKYLQHRCQPST